MNIAYRSFNKHLFKSQQFCSHCCYKLNSHILLNTNKPTKWYRHSLSPIDQSASNSEAALMAIQFRPIEASNPSSSCPRIYFRQRWASSHCLARKTNLETTGLERRGGHNNKSCLVLIKGPQRSLAVTNRAREGIRRRQRTHGEGSLRWVWWRFIFKRVLQSLHTFFFVFLLLSPSLPSPSRFQHACTLWYVNTKAWIFHLD